MATNTKQQLKERSVFVGNIPYDVPVSQLESLFNTVGRVLSFRLVMDRETNKPKGYGFCEFTDGATALSAMRNLNGTEVHGRPLRVDFADGGGSNTGSNLPPGSATLSGVEALEALDQAIATMGPIELHKMLTGFQSFAKQHPQHAKLIFQGYPAIAHAMVSALDLFDIEMTLAAMPSPSAAPNLPPPSSVPTPALATPQGGILGSAPLDAARHSSAMPFPPASRHQPPLPSHPPIPPHSRPPPVGGLLATPPRRSDHAVRIPSPEQMMDKSRDPRRRNHREASSSVKATSSASTMKNNRSLNEQEAQAIAELAKTMTPAKMALLPKEERELLEMYMGQMGISLSD